MRDITSLLRTISVYIDDSSERMELSSSKRKRKHHPVDEEELLHSLKKMPKTNNDIKKEFVNRKEQAHSLSSSDSECSTKIPSTSVPAKTSLNGNNPRNKLNYLLTSDESSSERTCKSIKKPKSSKKSVNFINVKSEYDLFSSEKGFSSKTKESVNLTHVKQEFNHSLSSDDGCRNKTSSPNIKVPQKSGKSKEVKVKTEVDELSDFDYKIIETGQSDEDSSPQDQNKLKTYSFSTHVKDKAYKKQAFSQDDEKELSKYSLLLDEELAENNNIWILQCPNSLDCAELVGQSLDLTGKGSARLKFGNTVFEAYCYRDHTSRSATLAVPSSSNQLHLCKIPVTGNIILEESVDVVDRKILSIPDPPQCVELPQNLRIRHPLLGLDYERKASISSFPIRQKKAKKKKHSKSFSEISYSNGVQEDDVETAYEEREVKKKKHKKKRSFKEESS